MAYQYYQNNPLNKSVGDCVIRAICKALDEDWYKVYADLTLQGYKQCDLPSSNAVWNEYLIDKGYKRYIIPDLCPTCYTVRDFVNDNPVGTFILATGSHLITAIDGIYFDSWDSGNEVPIFYYTKEVDNA